MAKIAPGSLWKMSDQERWYREMMGDDAANRQIELAKKERGKCICKTDTKERTITRRWYGNQVAASSRTVHAPVCPKWEPWMAEA